MKFIRSSSGFERIRMNYGSEILKPLSWEQIHAIELRIIGNKQRTSPILMHEAGPFCSLRYHWLEASFKKHTTCSLGHPGVLPPVGDRWNIVEGV